MTAAAAATAQTDRERSVAANELGDVLREAGDLGGAQGRHEAGLALRERLARDNPSHPGFQRDAEITRARLAALEGG